LGRFSLPVASPTKTRPTVMQSSNASKKKNTLLLNKVIYRLFNKPNKNHIDNHNFLWLAVNYESLFMYQVFFIST
jgi:hypothetical protein